MTGVIVERQAGRLPYKKPVSGDLCEEARWGDKMVSRLGGMWCIVAVL